MRESAGCDFERTVVVRGAEQARLTSALRAGVLRRAVSAWGTAQKRGALATPRRFAGSAANPRGVRASPSWAGAWCGVASSYASGNPVLRSPLPPASMVSTNNSGGHHARLQTLFAPTPRRRPEGPRAGRVRRAWCVSGQGRAGARPERQSRAQVAPPGEPLRGCSHAGAEHRAVHRTAAGTVDARCCCRHPHRTASRHDIGRDHVACIGGDRVRRVDAGAAEVIRIDAVWLAVEPLDMRGGTETALDRVVQVCGAARPHHAYLFANRRANRLKVLVHDGIGVWLAARRLHQGHFIWPRLTSATLQLTRAQLDALVLGLPWQRIGEAGVIAVL